MSREDRIAVMRRCREQSIQGRMAFPEVVRALHEIGVERYHTDLVRDESTFYMPDGDSHVISAGSHPRAPIADAFDAGAVESAIRRIQRQEIDYFDFLRRIMAAGCVGYFVQITGRRALYFGRDGDVHVEHFPVVASPSEP